MTQFKLGDKVKRIRSVYNGMEIGDTSEVIGFNYGCLVLMGYRGDHDPLNFELVKQEFDMQTMPWYIRYSNEQEFNLAQDWLEENYGKKMGCHYVAYSDILSNVNDCGIVRPRVMHGRVENRHPSAKEILLKHKTITDVIWPEVEPPLTEAQKKIKELENTINSAKIQIEQLKGEIK